MNQPASKRILTEDRGLITTTIQATQYSLSADGTTRQQAPSTPAGFGTITGTGAGAVFVDPGSVHQPILGFGGAVTGATAYNLLNRLSATQRTALLRELFAPSGLNLSTVMVTMGTSDFDANMYTYDDQPLGTTDATLAGFSVAREERDKILILREILAINPRVKVFAAPWTPPAWMKAVPAVGLAPGEGNNGNTVNPTYWSAYAQYFVKFIQAYKAHGISIYAVSPQNEPTSATQNWPCLYMPAADQITFIGTYLGPAFDAAGITTRIIAWKSNFGSIGLTYADTVLSDPTANSYIDGVGWHWYAGAPEGSQSVISRKYPTKASYMLEACDSGALAGTVANYYNKVFIGSMRAGSRAAILWNIALDENGRPHNRGDGNLLHGLITVPSDGSGNIVRTTDYYVLAQTSKYVKAGASRIGSTDDPAGIRSVAYLNPDGSVVTVVWNQLGTAQTIQIIDARAAQGFPVTLPAGEVATFVWQGTPVSTTTLAITKPNAPTLTVTPGANQNVLTWAPAADVAAATSAFLIYSGPNASSLKLLAAVPASQTTYTDTTVLPGTAVTYTVTPVNAGGSGTASAAASGTATNPDTRTVLPPQTLTQPLLWLRSDKITGVADGGAVTTWPDSGPAGLAAAIPSGANGPTLKLNAINGLPVVQFRRATSQKLTTPFQHIVRNMVYLVVARMPSLSTVFLYGTSDGTGATKPGYGLNVYFASGGSNNTPIAQILASGSGTLVTANGPSNAVPAINTGFIHRVSVGTGATAVSAVNGTEGAQGGGAAYTPTMVTGFTLGSIGSDAGDVDVAELIVLKNPTTAEVHTWTQYLGSVYGVTVGAA